MKTATSPSWRLAASCLGVLLALCVGCSSSDSDKDAGNTNPDAPPPADQGENPEPDAPAGPQPYGSPCEGSEDCSSKVCVAGRCSKLCKNLSDCEPVRVDPDPNKSPGSAGGPCRDDGTCNRGLLCYLGKECLLAFDCGRVEETGIVCYPRDYDFRPYTSGHDCSADGLCANTYLCMGQRSTTDRFCSPACENDRQCPPSYRCANMTTPDDKTDQRCMPRKMGHPCDIDDQCGGPEATEWGCIQDPGGKNYCSKTCTPTDTGTCPPFAKCEEAGNGRKMCKYKAGFAYTEGGDLCAPCIHHGENDNKLYYEAGGCAEGGFCFVLSPYTGEASCLTPCDAGGGCPANHECFEFTAGDKKKPVCAPVKEVYGQLTISACYPAPAR